MTFRISPHTNVARSEARNSRQAAMSTVKIPPVLRSSTGGAKEVAADGSDVGEVLRAMEEHLRASRRG